MAPACTNRPALSGLVRTVRALHRTKPWRAALNTSSARRITIVGVKRAFGSQSGFTSIHGGIPWRPVPAAAVGRERRFKAPGLAPGLRVAVEPGTSHKRQSERASFWANIGR